MGGLLQLEARNLRCFESVTLAPDPEVTYIVGPNASGKTSLLEAIFLAGRGRSFRASRTRTIIRDGADAFEVVARVRREQPPDVVLGLRGESGRLIARAGGQAVKSLSELAIHLPVQIIDARVHELVEGAPAMRRRFLDWGVFHVKHTFLDDWRRYSRALRQRNAALRAGQPEKIVRAWDRELIETAGLVSQARRAYLAELTPVIREMVQILLQADLELAYHEGWRADTSFQDALGASFARDKAHGTTHVGVHRADLALQLSGDRARDRTSRGQQKLLAAACLMAQSWLIAERNPRRVLLLVDDPAAELDAARQTLFLELLGASPTQRIVTALSDDNLPADAQKVFHVEQGILQEVV